MNKERSERAKIHKEMLTAAVKMPGVATAMEVLAQWQKLDDVEKGVQAAKTRLRITSRTNTCR